MFKILDGRKDFYQWDLNQKLIVEDANVSEVHFCNRTSECSLKMPVYNWDGQRLVEVPNIILTNPWHVRAYAYIKEPDCSYTKVEEVFNVKARSKPDDYVYTQNEVDTYSELVERIDEIEREGISQEAIDSAITRYLEENPVEAGATAEEAAQIEQNKQDIAAIPSTYATKTELRKIELTPGPQGPQGVPGKDGADGKDGAQGPIGPQGPAGKDGATGPQGPVGPAGADGEDYTLTDEDKASIARLVEATMGGHPIQYAQGSIFRVWEQTKTCLWYLAPEVTLYYRNNAAVGKEGYIVMVEWSTDKIEAMVWGADGSLGKIVCPKTGGAVFDITMSGTYTRYTADLSNYYTKAEVDQKIASAGSGGTIDLSNYYTKLEVDTAIETIELTPGPQGPQGIQGEPGKDGEPGRDGVDGAPGKDGVDGYTPVKGVDYFDGVDGAPGEKGDPFTYEDFTAEQLAALKGEPGQDGVNGQDGAPGADGTPGQDGKDGATYTPAVDQYGNISWTNDQGLPNPASTNIKGPQGFPGNDGAQGPRGLPGYTPVKGVDYFDGKDGYTPVKGVDYFDGVDGKNGKDGADGAPGADGKDGQDYVLTENDKTEIASIVLAELTNAEVNLY